MECRMEGISFQVFHVHADRFLGFPHEFRVETREETLSCAPGEVGETPESLVIPGLIWMSYIATKSIRIYIYIYVVLSEKKKKYHKLLSVPFVVSIWP